MTVSCVREVVLCTKIEFLVVLADSSKCALIRCKTDCV